MTENTFRASQNMKRGSGGHLESNTFTGLLQIMLGNLRKSLKHSIRKYPIKIIQQILHMEALVSRNKHIFFLNLSIYALVNDFHVLGYFLKIFTKNTTLIIFHSRELISLFFNDSLRNSKPNISTQLFQNF